MVIIMLIRVKEGMPVHMGFYQNFMSIAYYSVLVYMIITYLLQGVY